MTSDTYRVVPITQGTDEWREWRLNGIGSSDTPIIMGENPFKTASALLKERKASFMGWRKNWKMERGVTLEPEALSRYCELVKQTVKPTCVESICLPWLRASLDGLSDDRKIVVEIKCGDSVYNKTLADRKPPRICYGQLQHILAVTGFAVIDFFFHLPYKKEILLKVKRDDDYIKRMIESVGRFYSSLK